MHVRDRLLTAAARLFAEAGSRGATTRRIAAEAGVNEITLFRHFGSKAALLSEALGRAAGARAEPCLPAEPVDPEAELLEWSRCGYGYLRASAAMLRTAMGEMEQSPEAARCAAGNPARAHDELRRYLMALRERGLCEDGWEPGAAASMLMGALFGDAVSRDLMPETFPVAEDEAPARYVALFLRAIGCTAVAAGSAPSSAERG